MITEKLEILSIQRGLSPDTTSKRDKEKEDPILSKLKDVEKKMNKIWSDYNKASSKKPSDPEEVKENAENIKDLTLHCMTLCEKVEANNVICLSIAENQASTKDAMKKEESKQELCFKKIEDDFVTIAATTRSGLRELRELQANFDMRTNRQNVHNNCVLA